MSTLRRNLRQILPAIYFLLASLILLFILQYTIIPRQIGLTFRYDLFIPLAFFLIVFFPLFLQKSLPFKIASFVVLMIFFMLPLSGLWASGQSEQYLLGGIIPFSDSRGYYADARALMEGQKMFTSHSRRPLFAAFFGPILALTSGNLQLSLAIILVITVIACYLCAREIQASIGSLAAIVTLILFFFFFRPIVGKVLSEDIGYPLCVLGLTLFLFSARRENLLAAYFGLFLVTFGLVARAGAFFLLPALAGWLVWHFRRNGKIVFRQVLLSLGVIGFAFVLNQIAFYTIVSPGIAPFNNFGLTFYGLVVGGKGWQQILVDHPEITGLSDPEYSRTVMNLTLDFIQRKPLYLLRGAWNYWSVFFSLDDYYSVFNWVSGSRPLIDAIFRSVLYVLILLGIVDSVRFRSQPIRQLSLLAFVGIVLSVPFAPPPDSNRMRIYASAIPFFFLMPALGLSSLVKWRKIDFIAKPRDVQPAFSYATFLAVFIVAITILGPFITLAAARSPHPVAVQCQPGQTSVIVRILPGSFVNLTDPDTNDPDWLPNIRQSTFITRAHNLPNWELFPVIDNLPVGKTIMNELDVSQKKLILFIANTSSLPPLPALVQSCGEYSKDRMVREYNVFYADSITKID